MRHPLLKFLAALLIGVWSPICCCRALAMVGAQCGDVAVAEVDRCCGNSGTQVRGVEHSDHSPRSEHEQVPGGCSDCATCTRASASLGFKVETEPRCVEALCQLCAVAWVVAIVPVASDDVVAMRRPAWWASPPHVKSNRDALRWHCALVV